MTNLNEKNYATVLAETHDYFEAQGMSILGEGYKEIATQKTLFEDYIDNLCQGVSANHEETMKQLMRNSNKDILIESSMTGIAPIASLSMPVIRKLWPKFALKDAVKEEVAKSPRFVISYTKPYMFRGREDGTEERIDLPMGLKQAGKNALSEAGRKEVCKRLVKITSDAPTAIVNFADPNYTLKTGEVGSAYVASTGSAVKVQPLDRDFIVTAVEVDGKAYKVAGKLDINNTVVADVTVGNEDITLLVRVNLELAMAKVSVIGYTGEDDLTVKIVAPISSEYNERSWSVGFNIERLDVVIPTGQHLNAPLPIEAIKDMMTLYQIDGTKETVDLMTDAFANKLDLEILEFLKSSYMNQPGNVYSYLPEASDYSFTFDCRPMPGYAGSPKTWREELKPQIDFLAQKVKNATYLNSGCFVIVCNPLDAMVLTNIDWQFRGGQGSNVDGVDIDYSVGTFVGANTYRVISSTNVEAGAMFVLFLPNSDKQMTYKYYPYSFNVEHGYIDANRTHTPSIMMTKRDTKQAFLPAIGVIYILNNDGQGHFNTAIRVQSWDEDGDDTVVEGGNGTKTE